MIIFIFNIYQNDDNYEQHGKYVIIYKIMGNTLV